VILERGLEFVLVMEFAQVGAVLKMGLQVGVIKFEWSSLGVQVGVFKSGCSSQAVQVGCCEFLVSIFRWIKPRHSVKVNPLGEVKQARTMLDSFVLPVRVQSGFREKL
jgi:hypothetical protein